MGNKQYLKKFYYMAYTELFLRNHLLRCLGKHTVDISQSEKSNLFHFHFKR